MGFNARPNRPGRVGARVVPSSVIASSVSAATAFSLPVLRKTSAEFFISNAAFSSLLTSSVPVPFRGN